MINRDTAIQLISELLASTAEEIGFSSVEGITEHTVIFGQGSPLDSMGLVILIADLEAAFFTRTGESLILADERAMSRSRSPFRTVGALAEFVAEISRHET